MSISAVVSSGVKSTLCKNGNTKHSFILKTDKGESWVSYFTKAEQAPVSRGDTVDVEVVKKGAGINVQSLRVTGKTKVNTSTSKPGFTDQNQKAIKVGRAINNAVAILVAKGEAVDLAAVEKVALGIIGLEDRLMEDKPATQEAPAVAGTAATENLFNSETKDEEELNDELPF